MLPENSQIAFKSYREEAIYRLNVGFSLGYELVRNAFKEILSLEDASVQYVYMGILLNGLMRQNLSLYEVAGLLDAAFELDNYSPLAKIEIPSRERRNRHAVAVMGSGKKGIKTFNVTSLATLVAACDSILIVKPCSHSTSSVTGSSDFLSLVGINIDMPHEQMLDVMLKSNVGYFSIERTIPNFDKIYGGKFFAPHALSFALGGLLAPVKTDSLIYGLAHPNIIVALEVFKHYQVQNAICLASTNDGIHYSDDILPLGRTYIQGYYSDGKMGNHKTLHVRDVLGLPHYMTKDIGQATTPQENVIKGLLGVCSNSCPAISDTIAINAATLLYMADRVENIREGYIRAKEIIQSKQVPEKLEQVVELTGGDKHKLYAVFDEIKKTL